MSTKTASLKDVLATLPPGPTVQLTDEILVGSDVPRIRVPMLELFCEACDGDRIFKSDTFAFPIESSTRFLEFTCQNCKGVKKIYALLVACDDDVDDDATDDYCVY